MPNAVRTNIARKSTTNRSRITNDPVRGGDVDARTPYGRRRRDLLNAYVESLGGRAAVSDAQMPDLLRAAELTAIAEEMRRRFGTGETVDVDALVRLENMASRSIRRLGIKPSAGPKAQSLAEYLADRQAAASSAPPGSAGVVERDEPEGISAGSSEAEAAE